MKIIIADSSPLFRNGLNLCLQKVFTAAKVEQLSGFSEIINTLNLQNDISLIILDVDLRDLPWHESLIKIRQLAPNSKIVVRRYFNYQTHNLCRHQRLYFENSRNERN